MEGKQHSTRDVVFADKPQPCSHHKGRTFCESDPASGQCDRPSVAKCPPCPKGFGPGIDLHGGDLPGANLPINYQPEYSLDKTIN